MDGTHDRNTFENDPKQQLLRGQLMGIGTMAVQAGNRMQMLGMILVTGEEPIIESEFTV